MKKAFLLLAFVALSSASALAQGEIKSTTADPQTGAKQTTEVDVRDNGTVKAETTTRTGRTKAGQAAYNTGQDAKRVGRKAGNTVEKGAKKTGHAVKKGAKAVKNKAEDVVD